MAEAVLGRVAPGPGCLEGTHLGLWGHCGAKRIKSMVPGRCWCDLGPRAPGLSACRVSALGTRSRQNWPRSNSPQKANHRRRPGWGRGLGVPDALQAGNHISLPSFGDPVSLCPKAGPVSRSGRPQGERGTSTHPDGSLALSPESISGRGNLIYEEALVDLRSRIRKQEKQGQDFQKGPGSGGSRLAGFPEDRTGLEGVGVS